MTHSALAVKQIRLIAILASLSFLLSVIVIVVNQNLFHFPGNNYYPDGSLRVGITLILMYIAAYVQFGAQSNYCKIMMYILAFYGVLALIVLNTYAVQYTPFKPIDHLILKYEPIKLLPLVTWSHQHLFFGRLLAHIYNSLNTEIVVIPLILILLRKQDYFFEYLILMLSSAILGYGFYYFYPSTAPASIIHSDYFTASQIATGLKFYEIHHHIQPSTSEGGLVALPSFHVIWAWLTLYAIRSIRPLYFILLPYNALIAVSCVSLGWHYFGDIFGSMLVLILVHGLCVMHGTATKRCKSCGENHTNIQQVSVCNDTIA